LQISRTVSTDSGLAVMVATTTTGMAITLLRHRETAVSQQKCECEPAKRKFRVGLPGETRDQCGEWCK
jgi:hypothetical protein